MTIQEFSRRSRFEAMAFSIGVLAIFGSGANAQVPFSRYFGDQQHRKVVIDESWSAFSPSAGETRLSEREAIERALKHNLDVNVQRYDPIAAEWAVQGLEAVYDPEAYFNFTWNRLKVPSTSILQGRESLSTIVTAGDAGVHKFFPTGTSVEVYFNTRRDRTTSFFSNINPAINTNLGVLVRQNLLEGFGKAGAQYQIEISRNNVAISEQEFRRQASELILRVQQAYWDLRFAIEDVDVKQKALDAARVLRDQNQVRFEVGTGARLDVAQSEAELALRQEELTRAMAVRKILQDQLVALISSADDPRDFPGALVPDRPSDLYPPVEAFDELRRMADTLRPEMQQSEIKIENQQVNLNASRNALRPTLDLVAGYEQFGLGGHERVLDFSGGITDPVVIDVIPGGIGDSLDRLFSSRFYGYLVGLDFRIPLGNSDARARNAQAQIGYEKAVLEKRSLGQIVSLQIRDALTRIETSRASINSSQAAVEAASERLEAEEARFEVGAGTTRELIEAQRDLLFAASILVRARTELAKSHAALDRAVGRSFERQGIVLADELSRNVVGP